MKKPMKLYHLTKNKYAGSVYLQMIFVFFRFLLVLFIVFSIVFIVRSHFKVKIDILDAELNLLAHTMLYAPGGVSYQDPITSRVYPGIIYLEEFENTFTMSSRLNQAFYYEKQPVFAAALILDIPQQNKKVEGVYYQKEWYDKWNPLAASRLIGSGSVIKKKFTFNVLVKALDQQQGQEDQTNNQLKTFPGKLTIDIVTPKP